MRFEPRPIEQPQGVLQRLLCEVIPERLISRAATVGPGGALDAPIDLRRRNGVKYLHSLAAGRIAKPPPDEVWWAGMAAAAVTSVPWCNPSLFLFAAGHYVEFAWVLLSADDRIPQRRRRELALTVVSATEPTPPLPTREELVRRNIETGHNELAARRAADWDLQMKPKERYDRLTWSISGSESETLLASWEAYCRSGPDMSHPAVAACYLAASGRVDKQGPDLSLALRARVAANAVAASLQ